MSEAAISAQLSELTKLVNTMITRFTNDISNLRSDIQTASSASQAALANMQALVTATSNLFDLVTELQTAIGDVPTTDSSSVINSTSDIADQIKDTVDNINAAMIAFDPTIISDLTAIVDSLSDKIGDVPADTNIWSYLQGVTNIDSTDEDDVRTTVNGCVLDSNENPIKNALVEIINSSSVTVGQTYTLADGTWKIVVDSGATYTVRVTVANYKPFTKTITITAGVTTYEVT